LHGRKDFHIRNPDELFYEEPGFRSVLEYIDCEASRSRVLLTSTTQGKAVNNLFLRIHDALNELEAKYTLFVEPVYRMAVLRITVESELLNRVLMPVFEEYKSDIAEIEIQPWTNEEKIVLIFVDNVFEEIVPDDNAEFLFERLEPSQDENRSVDIVNLEDKISYCEEYEDEVEYDYEDEVGCDYEDEVGCDYEDEVECDYEEDYDSNENTEPKTYSSVKEMLRSLFGITWYYLIDSEKMAVVNRVYQQLRKILDACNAKYTIQVMGDVRWESIQVVTDAFDPEDCNGTMEAYRDVINHVDFMRQNTYEGKIVMTYTFSDVHTYLHPAVQENEFDDCTDYEREG